MRKTVYVCDACGKELDPEKGVWKVTLCTKDSADGDEIGKELLDKEFCALCIGKVAKFLGVKSMMPKKGTGAGRRGRRKPKQEGAVNAAKGPAPEPKTLEKPSPAPEKIAAPEVSAPEKPKEKAPAEAAKTPTSEKAAQKKVKARNRSLEELDPQDAVLLGQEIRFFLENGQKKEDIIPELMHSYRVSEETVKEMITQYEELSGKEEGKLMDEK